MAWRYRLGVRRLEELGLQVVNAPHSLKGSAFLSQHPEARAEDFQWAFENPEVKAIIANVGGCDSHRLLPFLHAEWVQKHPKILIGTSDVMNLHIFCYKNGLSSFYGGNLLSPVADPEGWHPYSREWFRKVLFDGEPIGKIHPASEWTYDPVDYPNKKQRRTYDPCDGYTLIQGERRVQGRLLGGHTGLMELENTVLALTAEDFYQKILFVEDIPEFFTPAAAAGFFEWMGSNGVLQALSGVVIGRIQQAGGFQFHAAAIRQVMERYGRLDLPILYGLHFGHTSPACVLPYGAMAEIDCQQRTFTILEEGVI